MKSYIAGDQVDDTIRLNANEAPFSGDNPALNRYPDVRPAGLRDRIAELFSMPAGNVLVTRGTSEAIDVLIKAWCRAYRDTLVTTPPTFDMYRFYADIQGVGNIEVPLVEADNFALDAVALLAACDEHTRLLFICSPNNPTGTLVPRDTILDIATARSGQSLVIVDEAYVEFADRESMAVDVLNHENLVVLRTLSKAHALAGARCGAAIASEEIIDVMSKVLPPYSFPTPVINAVMATLSVDRVQQAEIALKNIVNERERLFDRLGGMNCIETVWPSQSNFIFTRFHDLAAALDFLHDRKILIRDFSKAPGAANCARITIGTPAENDALLQALTDFGHKTDG